eukprot:4536669-Amphidinium_carterae.3
MPVGRVELLNLDCGLQLRIPSSVNCQVHCVVRAIVKTMVFVHAVAPCFFAPLDGTIANVLRIFVVLLTTTSTRGRAYCLGLPLSGWRRPLRTPLHCLEIFEICEFTALYTVLDVQEAQLYVFCLLVETKFASDSFASRAVSVDWHCDVWAAIGNCK